MVDRRLLAGSVSRWRLGSLLYDACLHSLLSKVVNFLLYLLFLRFLEDFLECLIDFLLEVEELLELEDEVEDDEEESSYDGSEGCKFCDKESSLV